MNKEYIQAIREIIWEMSDRMSDLEKNFPNEELPKEIDEIWMDITAWEWEQENKPK